MLSPLSGIRSVQELFALDTPLAGVMDVIFDGIYVVDRTRHIVFWNRGAEEITGFTRAEVTSRCCADNILCHVDEHGTPLCFTRCPLLESMQTGTDRRAKVYPYHKSRRRIPVLTHVSPIRGLNGDVIGAIEVFRDITHEDEFRVLQEKFNDLIRRYVSSTTFEDVMNQAQGVALEDSCKRDRTVMFIDVVGFTGFTEQHAASEVIRLLNDLFAVSEDTIHECQGDIDKLIGDAVLAVFADANDAVRAGKLLLQRLADLNARRALDEQAPVAVRIGVHSGPVIQGDIGGTNRKDRTVIGDVVNTAARIEKLSAPNGLLISEATYARLRDPAGLVLDRRVQVRGKEEELALFRYGGARIETAIY